VRALGELAHDALPIRGGGPRELHAAAAAWREVVQGGEAGLGERARHAFLMLILGQRMKADRHPLAEAQLEVGKALILGLPPEEASALIAWAGALESTLPPLAAVRSCSSGTDGACSAPCPRGRGSASPKRRMKKRRGHR
jgi:hypothetical protein